MTSPIPKSLPVFIIFGLLMALGRNGYCDRELAMITDPFLNDMSHPTHIGDDISPDTALLNDISTPLRFTATDLSFGGSGKEEGVSIVRSRDGFFLVGTSYSEDLPGYKGGLCDIYVVMIDDKGRRLWERTFGTPLADKATTAVGQADGSCIITGTTANISLFDNEELPVPGSADILVLKISPQGTLLWETRLNNDDSIYHADDYGRSALSVSDSRILVVGHSWAHTDIWITCLDTQNGATVFEKRINGKACTLDPKSITRTSDGGYLLTGEGGLNAFAMKLNDRLDTEWQTLFQGNSLDTLNAAVELDDGFLFVGGTSSTIRKVSPSDTRKLTTGDTDIRDQEIYLVKTDKNGRSRARLWNYPHYEAPINSQWEIGIGWLESGWSDISQTNLGSEFEDDCAYQITRRPDGTCIVMGTGACHQNGAGVTGRGQMGRVEHGALIMSLNPNARARDSIRDDDVFTWHDQFRRECLQWKKMHTDIDSVRAFVPIDQGYLLLGSDKNNNMKLIAVRDDGSRF